MRLYIKKKTVHLVLFVLLLLAASVTVVAAQQQQRLKQQAATDQKAYSEPPMYGCLQMGEGSNKSCASKLLKTELDVSLRGFSAKGGKVFYNETLEATLTISNPGDLPLKIKKLGVVGRAVAAKYQVDFKPLKEDFSIGPGETVTLGGAKHKFNNPDPGGPWEIVSLMVDDNGNTVSDVQKVDLEVDTTCKALLRVPFTDAEIAEMETKCNANKNDAGCNDFCVIFADRCTGQSSTPDTQCQQNCSKDVNPPTSCYPANTRGANGGVPACGAYHLNRTGDACNDPNQCPTGKTCTNNKCT